MGGVYVPESPAMSTLSLPIRLPSSVKGRRDGILMEGMTSWGALPLSIMAGSSGFGSASSVRLRAWLATSSQKTDAVTEFLREETPLMAEAGPEAGSIMGVIGMDGSLLTVGWYFLCEEGASEARETASSWSW